MMLRSKDLLWSRIIHEYMMETSTERFDGLECRHHQNAFTGCTPSICTLFLNNDLAEGRFGGRKAHLPADIRVPLFAVGATKDHVAPWESVFKIRQLTGSPDNLSLDRRWAQCRNHQ